MKLLGLACGKKMGNCEILLKEALMEAERPFSRPWRKEKGMDK